MRRVEADVEGLGDVPPQTLSVDVRAVLKAFRKESSVAAWDYSAVKTRPEAF